MSGNLLLESFLIGATVHQLCNFCKSIAVLILVSNDFCQVGILENFNFNETAN